MLYYSAGFPVLLDEWIKSSNDLKDYDKIKRDKLCTLIIGLEDGLDAVLLCRTLILERIHKEMSKS
jgi:hypothetical protein